MGELKKYLSTHGEHLQEVPPHSTNRAMLVQQCIQYLRRIKHCVHLIKDENVLRELNNKLKELSDDVILRVCLDHGLPLIELQPDGEVHPLSRRKHGKRKHPETLRAYVKADFVKRDAWHSIAEPSEEQ